MAEFNLIQRFFTQSTAYQPFTQLGVGDDCALLNIPKGQTLAVTTDTMVEGVHFFSHVDPYSLGHKLLAVNLSDLAAMGAKPVAVTLALCLPSIDENWLGQFSTGFFELAKQFSIDLIGGDTSAANTRILTVQALGLVPIGQALRRSNAQIDDYIFVTGQLGQAGLGFKIEKGFQSHFAQSALADFHQPQPKIQQGLKLRDYANACIDLSDGIASDLGHILRQSQVGACLNWSNIPLSDGVKEYIDYTGDWLMPLTAGEDYQLCFTVSPDKLDLIDIDCTQIGKIEATPGLRLERLGKTKQLTVTGFEHFC